MVQRFVAIAKPEMEVEVTQFCTQHALEKDSLRLRYPFLLEPEAIR